MICDASNFKLILGVSGITFTGINPYITFPKRILPKFRKDD